MTSDPAPVDDWGPLDLLITYITKNICHSGGTPAGLWGYGTIPSSGEISSIYFESLPPMHTTGPVSSDNCSENSYYFYNGHAHMSFPYGHAHGVGWSQAQCQKKRHDIFVMATMSV